MAGSIREAVRRVKEGLSPAYKVEVEEENLQEQKTKEKKGKRKLR